MSYVESNLLAGETVRFRTRLHWKLYVWPLVVTLLVLVPLTVLMLRMHAGMWSGVLVPLGLLWLLAAHLRRASSEFAVTSKRVVIKMGVMSTRSLELLLPKVEGIAVNQGPGGKLFGYGSIVVTGSGGTRESFSDIQDPLALRRAIQEATDARDRSLGS